MIKRLAFNILLDIGYVAGGIVFASIIQKLDLIDYICFTYKVWLLFTAILLCVSFLYRKYQNSQPEKYYHLLLKVVKSWAGTVIVMVFLLYFINLFHEHRFILFISYLVILFFELVFSALVYFFRNAIYYEEKMEQEHLKTIQSAIKFEKCTKYQIQEIENKTEELFLRLSGELSEEVLKFIKDNAGASSEKILFLSTTDRFNVLQYTDNTFDVIVNIENANDIRRINKFFESINIKLKQQGLFIQCVETLAQRKKRYIATFPPVIAQLFYLFDFLIHRVWPRMPSVRKFYFAVFKGKNRRLSYAETLGRLYSCGFEFIADKEIDGITWFVVSKLRQPAMSYNVTYGPLIKLKRLGKNGKIIYVYKFRTMHPYSEYLQDFIYNKNNLAKGGKFKNDFRVSTIGRFFRKYWLDELPMFVNFFKGQIKFFGVRPLSEHYFSLYPEEYRLRRIKYKPGLIPPYYVHLPSSLNEIIESEKKYLDFFDKYRYWADFVYVLKALWNIITRKGKTS